MSYLNQALPILRWTAATGASVAHFVHAANAVATNELPPNLVETLEQSDIGSWGDLAGVAFDVVGIGLTQLLTAIPHELTTTFLVVWWPFETWNLYRKAKNALRSWRAKRNGRLPSEPGRSAAPKGLPKQFVATPVRQSRRARRRNRGKRR